MPTFAAVKFNFNAIIMPRQTRQTSGTGIYHVMLRGINHQDIFEERKDYWKFLRLLKLQTHPKDEKGIPLKPHCVIYAYCLMTNHVHMLIREGDKGIMEPIKSITIAYALYFNKRYNRTGHLFQDRFKSEPVNDMAYFVTLLRYIHQNPVAGGITKNVRDYTWSSWCEYEGRTCAIPVCTTQHVFARISCEDLTELINEPLAKALNILDFDNETIVRVTDEKVKDYVLSICGVSSLTEIQHLPKTQRNAVLRKVRDYGASIRQIARMTGISEGIIRNIK